MILVTGGAGFIGSVLAKELNNLGMNNLLIVDRLGESSKWLNLRSLKYIQYIHADELFLAENKEVLKQVKCIFHMGACSATTEKNMDYLMENNVEYSKKLYWLALDNEIPFIYASSAATYGDGELGYSDEGNIDDLIPLNPYGYSKFLFDRWLLERQRKPKHWFGLKFFNVYGPNEYHKDEQRSLVHKGFEQIKKTGKVRLFKSHKEGFNDGEQLRDFVYVKDIVNAMLLMMSPTAAAHSGIFNLGTGRAESFKQLVTSLFEAQGIPVNIEYIDMPEQLRSQYQYFTQAKMDKFKRSFPNFEFMDVKQGVDDYVKNYLLQGNPYY